MAEMASRPLDASTLWRLHEKAGAARWGVSPERLGVALSHGVIRTFGETDPTIGQLDRHFASLHLTDLALACACADGHEGAWEHFVREYRPLLYKAAAAIDASGGARELADGLYGELFGLTERDGRRRSHLEYFHGRSTLATWLRAVLSQRYIDRLRASKRVTTLPDEDSPAALPAPAAPPSAEHDRFVRQLRRALSSAVARLDPRERLRLACYYAQSLTLAEIGRLLGEHEATVSRQLARTRTRLRTEAERQLREAGLDDGGIAECFAAVAADPGPLDVAELLTPVSGKNPDPGRSTFREPIVGEERRG